MNTATRAEMTAWLSSNDCGEGLSPEFLNEQTDKYLRRVCQLAGHRFTNWLARQHRASPPEQDYFSDMRPLEEDW